MMQLSELLDKRLLFVSGKGGVGKTTISVLLALAAGDLRKKVLIVEMNSSGRVPPLFNGKSNGQQEVQLTPNVSAINLLPDQCFKEYAIRLLYFSALYKSFFTNRYVSNFINAVPGLDEFMMLAKVDQLIHQPRSKLSSQPKYDLIVIDAPATGHGLSVLEVPAIIGSAIRIGPPHKQAEAIQKLLADKSRTAFCLVTLAEEMPVCESQEYVNALRKKTELGFGPIFINAVMPPTLPVTPVDNLPKDLKIFQTYYELATKRAELNQVYVAEIEKRFPDFVKYRVPFYFEGLRSGKDFSTLLRHVKEVPK